MSTVAKNIIVILGIVTTVFAAYYFFTQEAALVLRTSESDQQLEQLLQAAEQFTARQRTLDSIELDTRVFTTPAFTALRDLTPPPAEFAVGRSDPFEPVAPGANEPVAPTE